MTNFAFREMHGEITWYDSEVREKGIGYFIKEVMEWLEKMGKAKVTHKWWKHPYFRRGSTTWLVWIDHQAYQVVYSSHETSKQLPSGQIDYINTITVHRMTKEEADRMWKRYLEVQEELKHRRGHIKS